MQLKQPLEPAGPGKAPAPPVPDVRSVVAGQQVPQISRKRSIHSFPFKVPEKEKILTPESTLHSTPTPPTSPVITISVGPEKRLFAAHESILSVSPFFASLCQTQNPNPPIRATRNIQHPARRLDLPDEQPEVLSCVLEYLYKGDYYPRLRHNARRRTWELEDAGVDGEGQSVGATVWHHAARTVILRDTAI